jgi:hypothetical protein
LRDQDLPNSWRRAFDADTYHPQPRAFGTRPRFSETQFESTFDPPVQAVVWSFNPEKGFGVVKLTDGSGDGFLHGTVAGNMLTSTDGTFVKPEFLGFQSRLARVPSIKLIGLDQLIHQVFMHKTG